MDVREKLSTEKRLIEYSFVVAQIEKLRMDAWRDKAQSEAYRKVEDILTNAPTVYAVEVVRCKDCKHHYWEQEPCHGKIVHYCKLPHMRGVEVFKEFFCYYGDRKEGAEC